MEIELRIGDWEYQGWEPPEEREPIEFEEDKVKAVKRVN